MNNLKIIDRISKLITPVIADNENKELDFPKNLMLLHVIERTKYSLYSLKVLIENSFDVNEHAISLLLRNLLSDFITFIYILTSSNQDELELRLFQLLNNDLNKAQNHFKLLEQINVQNELIKKAQNSFNEDSNIFSYVLDKKKELNLKSFPDNKKIIEVIHGQKEKSPYLEELVDAYDIWILFGKYEHIGIISYVVTRNYNPEIFKERLIHVLRKSVLLCACCADEIQEKELAKNLMNLYVEIKSEGSLAN